MTQAIREKNQASYPVWRKHSVPPGLWIAVVPTSIILHLFAIWFMKLSGGAQIW